MVLQPPSDTVTSDIDNSASASALCGGRGVLIIAIIQEEEQETEDIAISRQLASSRAQYPVLSINAPPGRSPSALGRSPGSRCRW